MEKIVKRAYKFRFTPDPFQERQMLRTFGCVRLVHNKALDLRSSAYQKDQSRITYDDTSKALTEWKRQPELAFLREVSAVALQQSLKHLDSGFQNFFKKTARYPKFKSRKRSKDSFTLMTNGFNFWRDEDCTPHLRLAKHRMELPVIWHREVPASVPSRVTISRDRAGRWFVSLLFEDVIDPKPYIGTMVGVDLGIGEDLAIVNDGVKTEKIPNQRNYRKLEKKLGRAQRKLARKEKGSRNRDKARLKVARIHARIADKRRNDLHQLTSRLVDENQVLVMETLNPAGLKRNHALAKSVSDASWGEFARQLKYKCDWAGRTLICIDRWFPSSQLCSNCLHRYRELTLAERAWTCENCGANHDRDENAAKNLRAAGTAVLACGEDVRLGDLIAYMRSESKAVLVEPGIQTDAVA